MDRAFERDIIPMARSLGKPSLLNLPLFTALIEHRKCMLGVALAPFNVLAGGRLRSDAEEERRRNTGENGRTIYGPNWERTPDERKMSAALEKVANEVARAQGKQEGAISVPAVAIAYVLHKTPYVFPIIGGRKIEHLMQNIEALSIALNEEQMKELEGVLPFEPGFPHNLIVGRLSRCLGAAV